MPFKAYHYASSSGDFYLSQSNGGSSWTGGLPIPNLRVFLCSCYGSTDVVVGTDIQGNFFSWVYGSAGWVQSPQIATPYQAYQPSAIIWDGSQHILLTSNQTGSFIRTSSDGLNWTPVLGSLANKAQAITYNGSIYVVIAQDGSVYTSASLSSWAYQGKLLTNPIGIQYSGVFVAWSSSTIWYSSDAITWTPCTITGAPNVVISNIVAGAASAQFLGVGSIYVPNWDRRRSGALGQPNQPEPGAYYLYYYGASDDGIHFNWSLFGDLPILQLPDNPNYNNVQKRFASGVPQAIDNVAYSATAGMWVASGSYSKVFSSDRMNWVLTFDPKAAYPCRGITSF